MTRSDLKNWIMQETAHCKTYDEVMDDVVRFIIQNFKMRKVMTVVDTSVPEPTISTKKGKRP